MIQKGEMFMCVEDVFMDDSNDFTLPQLPSYKKGEVYISKIDGCITDETGDDNHIWPEDKLFEKYFKRFVCPATKYESLETIRKRQEELIYAREIITQHNGTVIVVSGDTTHHMSDILDRGFVELLPELIDRRIEELSAEAKNLS